jgi:hypothetical protein
MVEGAGFVNRLKKSTLWTSREEAARQNRRQDPARYRGSDQTRKTIQKSQIGSRALFFLPKGTFA